MVARNRARYLAPVALAATIAATYLIAHSALSMKHATVRTVTAQRIAPHGKFAKASTYVVQPGDSLTSIARKTGVPLATLESLNPSVNPNSLQDGQRLRLRR